MRHPAIGLALILGQALLLAPDPLQAQSAVPERGFASWYGETHRGKTMANGEKFDPGKCTAASWFYPLGTSVRVTLASASEAGRSLVVTITDRGPARKWVERGRIIDLSEAAFKTLAPTNLGLVPVMVKEVRPVEDRSYLDCGVWWPADQPCAACHQRLCFSAAGPMWRNWQTR